MAETRPVLRTLDRLEITILMDNSIDVFLPDAKEVRRTRVPSDLPWGERKALVAEHGYSALVRDLTGSGFAFMTILNHGSERRSC